LRPPRLAARFGRPDLDDLLACVVQEGRQAGAIASDAFQSPAATAGDVLTSEVEQAAVAAGIGRGIGAGQEGADGTDGSRGEGVTVGIDADDAVNLFCEHGHAVALLRADDRNGVGLGGVTAWRNCDESRRKADKLLIKPTGGPGRRPDPADISGKRQPLTGRQLPRESCRITSVEPGSNPSRAAENPHSYLLRGPEMRPSAFGHGMT
jgi:hypothetical protein